MRGLKEARGCTQAEISSATGIPTGTIGKYFAGIEDEAANFEIVRKIVVYLGGSLDMLAGISGNASTDGDVVVSRTGDEISKAYEAIIAGLEARLSEKDKWFNQFYVRMQEAIQHERNRAKVAAIISYCALAVFVVVFFKILFYRRNRHGVTSIVPYSSEG